MNNYHYSHVIYQLSNKKNLIICISGKDTKSCEIYNIDENQWSNLPDFPIFSPNSECFDLNENIYVICGSFNIDGIYKLNMENDNENLIWENVNFIIEEGRLRRGMGLFNLNGIIYLFGGFDNDKYYDDVYTIDFNSNDIRVNFEYKMKLPCKSFFNCNTISVDYDNNERRIVLVDCMNGIIEYSTNTNFFYFYP
jgi:N-acetylneuraminic acid mutarotase